MVVVTLDLNAEQPVDFSQISDLNVLYHATFHFLDGQEVCCHNGAVVDVNHNDCK